jgi:hypothetical protein
LVRRRIVGYSGIIWLVILVAKDFIQSHLVQRVVGDLPLPISAPAVHFLPPVQEISITLRWTLRCVIKLSISPIFLSFLPPSPRCVVREGVLGKEIKEKDIYLFTNNGKK